MASAAGNTLCGACWQWVGHVSVTYAATHLLQHPLKVVLWVRDMSTHTQTESREAATALRTWQLPHPRSSGCVAIH